MSDESVFNINASSLRLGAVLAKGSSGITLYRAELQMGTRPMEVTCMATPCRLGTVLLKESVSPHCCLAM